MLQFAVLPMDAELANLRGLEFGDRLICLVQDREWDRLHRDQAVCQHLMTHCVLCGFRFQRAQEPQSHFRQEHPVRWELAPSKGAQLTTMYSSDSPSNVCGSGFKVHQCVVWNQIAVLLVNGVHRVEQRDTDVPFEVRHGCDMCLQHFDSVSDLTKHLQREHGLQGLSFNEARDSIDGCPACLRPMWTCLSDNGGTQDTHSSRQVFRIQPFGGGSSLSNCS